MVALYHQAPQLTGLQDIADRPIRHQQSHHVRRAELWRAQEGTTPAVQQRSDPVERAGPDPDRRRRIPMDA
jgi:hypothetical protein